MYQKDFLALQEGTLSNFRVSEKGVFHVYKNGEIVDTINADKTGIFVSLNVIPVHEDDIFKIEGDIDFDTKAESVEGRVMGLTVKVLWAPNDAKVRKGNMVIEIPKGQTGYFSSVTGWAFEDEEMIIEGAPVISYISTIGYYRDELILLADAAFVALVAQIEVVRGMKDFAPIFGAILRQSVTRTLQDCGNAANTILQSTQRNLVSVVNNQSDLLVIFRPYIRKLTEKAFSGFRQKVKVTRAIYDRVSCSTNFYPSRQTAHSFHSSAPTHEHLSVMTTKTIQEEVSNFPLERGKREVERKLTTRVPLSQKLNIKTTRRLNAFTKVNSPHITMRKQSLKVGIWT